MTLLDYKTKTQKNQKSLDFVVVKNFLPSAL